MQSCSRKYLSLIGIFLLFLQCSQEFGLEEKLYPTVETFIPSEVTENGANLKGELLFIGKEAILDLGFVYRNIPNPDIENAERISLGKTESPLRFQEFANRNLVKGKTYYVRTYAQTKSYLVYGNEVSFVSKGSSAPESKEFFPVEGVVGDTILLTGKGFSSFSAHNEVKFNMISVPVIKASSDTLWVVLPPASEPGENEISLKVGDYTVTFEKYFIVNEFSIESFSPTQLTFGDTLILKGNNFSRVKKYISALVFGVDGEVISSNGLVLKIKIPNELETNRSFINLTIAERTKKTQNAITLHPPQVQKFSPSSVTKDSRITIEGQFFNPLKDYNKVSINDVPLNIISSSPTSIVCSVPSGIKPGNYPLIVKILGLQDQSSNSIEVIKPEITGITPQEGTWEDEVTIWGRNFGEEVTSNTVLFNDVEAKVLQASSEKIVVRVPLGLNKKESGISIQVNSVDNLIATAEKKFLLHDPEIVDFYPKEGKSGTIVTISGQGFHPEESLVKFGDFICSIISSNSEEIKVQLPESLIDSEVNISLSFGELFDLSMHEFKLIAPWKRVADYPGPEKTEAVGFAIDHYGYVGLGSGDPLSFSKPFWKYIPATDHWTEISPYRYTTTGVASNFKNMTAFVVDGTAYAGIGGSGTAKINKLAAYLPVIDSWTSLEIADFPGDALEGLISFSLAGKGYVGTGKNSEGGSLQLWAYEPASNTWSRKANLPGDPRNESAAFTLGDRAYIVGGYFDGKFLSDVWIYDPARDKWHKKSDFPGTARSKAIAFSIQGKGYLMGGVRSHESSLNDIWQYNEADDTWKLIGVFPGPSRANSVVFVINGKAYIGTGETYYNLGRKHLKDFWEFDPAKL
jgi:N-acetylneuraminic acid mutarotase